MVEINRKESGKRRRGCSGEQGYSLVEIIIVTVVISVIASIAIFQFTSPRIQFARQNVSREFKVALERARFDSVKRRAAATSTYATVVVTPTSFTLFTDRNVNGTVEASEGLANSFAGANMVISHDAATFPITVAFNQRGEVSAIDGGGALVAPQFRVCIQSCASPTNANSDLLVVTPTGTVNLLPGGSTPPSFSPPAVSSVPAGTNWNPLVTVPAP